MVKIVIVAFLITVIAAFGSSLFFLVRGTSNETRSVRRAETVFIVLSFAFITFLMVAFFAGWIHPHGLRP